MKYNMRTRKTSRENNCPPNQMGTQYMMPITEQARLETQLGEYFIGNSGEVDVDVSGNGVVLFCNPKDSGVILSINYGEYDNYSDANTKIAVSSYGTVQGRLIESEFITSSLIRQNETKSKGKIYIGTNVEILNAQIDRILLLPSYQYKQVNTNGTLMLEPGENRIYEITTVDDNGDAVISIEFEWWEQPICNTTS